MNCPVTVRLGVYALGAADAAERLMVESHLPGCQDCRIELAQLEPLPGLLGRVPAGLVRTEPSPVTSRPATRRLSPARASRSAKAPWPAGRWRTALGLAAAAALFAAGGIWLAQSGASRPAQTAQRAALTLSGANPVTHVRVTAMLTRTSWGTRIWMVAWGLPRNQPCRLIIRSRSGATEVAGVWDAWRAGPVRVPASASWRVGDIASLQVATPARTLVTVPVVRPGAQVPPTSGP